MVRPELNRRMVRYRTAGIMTLRTASRPLDDPMNNEHVALLRKGAATWNKWRREKPDIRPDLHGARLRGADLRKANLYNADLQGTNFSEADLREANLREADLGQANLSGANLSKANVYKANVSGANLSKAKLSGVLLSGADLRGARLYKANVSGANLSEANLGAANLRGANLSKAALSEANLSEANLSGANLIGADLTEAALSGAALNAANLSWAELNGANLSGAKLNGANLLGADLRRATLVGTNLTGADLTGCRIYGVSAWGLKLDGAKQQNLIITPSNEPEITVDNIEVAQFIYLMLNNERVRDVIDTITSKAVLILGRFTERRKPILEALRKELRQREYLPILFDFEKPRNRDTDETITLLARMARFVVADISDAKSVLQELRAIVPDLPSVPVQPIILAKQEEPGMFDFFRKYPWVLKVHHYASQKKLIAELGETVIRPAERFVRHGSAISTGTASRPPRRRRRSAPSR